MKHKFAFKVTLWWLILLLLLGAAMLVFGEKAPRESLMENRMLAGFPKLTPGTVLSGEFMSGFESFLSDSFFGRETLVNLSDAAMGVFSRQSTEELLNADIAEAIDDEFAGKDPEAAGDTTLAQADVEAVEPEPPVGEDEPTADEAEPVPADEPMPADEPIVPAADALPVPEDVPVDEPIAPAEPIVKAGAEASGQVTVGSAPSVRAEDYTPLKEYNFWMENVDGGLTLVYTYTPESIEKLMKGLNGIRAALPSDGTVHFALVPVAQSANRWTRNTDTFSGWRSNAEEYMAALAEDGVYIYNGPELLAKGLSKGQYLYYRTDHHWTPRGAYTVARAMLQNQGLPVNRFDDYVYKLNKGYLGSLYTQNPSAQLKAMADDIEIPSSLAPVHSYIISQLTESKELGYMADYSNYLAFLQGTQVPWRRIVTGFTPGRKCLLISDSFGNCFAPYLVPYYDEVHMVDLRKGNFKQEDAGYPVGRYMDHYGIDDVYVVLCTASGLNYNYATEYLTQYLNGF